ncbi:PEP-CTERM sorting domain-containing protein [Lusitaniella coriacea LEGE 07157]|uniref:PEP-CTERM sorting domain-containing protein n=1 Tax=Lusitaniella coriacea LEGE 07157 TaxID=945747 RepID=A0A8J7DWF0_9CYAN|nr:CpcT/CpeT family chromophore lyase [Lusitaniella coriacea]MBE9116386.1 PEP-CTERM sorting domain-containing protein [Lusitaniella coriacea LEGE 07157]
MKSTLRPLKAGACAALLMATLTPSAAAATLSPSERVQQVADWFTGLFDNKTQVKNDSSIPFLTMENCAVSASGDGSSARYVHLEQYFGNTGRLLRSSAYEFSPSESGVDLSVFTYRDRASALGTCDRAMPTLDFSNLTLPSCDLMLDYKPNEFFGTNAPVGCPTSFPIPGSTVVSTVTISADAIDSLDTFILPTGGSIGTSIAFRPVSTPEPTMVLGLIAMGLMVVARKRQES